MKGKDNQAPSTIIIFVFAVLCLIALAPAYNSEFHHSWAFSTVGNSRTTILSGSQSPSRVSVFPPRTTNFPLKAAIVAGVSFLYSSYSLWSSIETSTITYADIARILSSDPFLDLIRVDLQPAR